MGTKQSDVSARLFQKKDIIFLVGGAIYLGIIAIPWFPVRIALILLLIVTAWKTNYESARRPGKVFFLICFAGSQFWNAFSTFIPDMNIRLLLGGMYLTWAYWVSIYAQRLLALRNELAISQNVLREIRERVNDAGTTNRAPI